MVRTERKDAALAAAASAMEAVQELLRYAREGAHYRQPPFGDVDVPELLADAARAALEIESDEQQDGPPRDDADERNWFVGAIGRFLDGWVP
jgi:hypothetical protein